MFGIGSTELLVILLVALIVLGPKSLAKVSRSLGKAMGEFRRVSTDFQRTLNAESAEADLREQEAARRRKEAAGAAAADKPAPAQPAHEAAAAATADEADSLTPPEGSPLAEALAKARAEAEAATGAAPDSGKASRAAAGASPSSAPHEDGPRA
ncbi:MAG: Sec-independent protein translocase protein TatB [Desulfovibrio sp.]|nr:Sec-independent protein translocase protein TatB [Desulfovibrio sp.]